MPKIGDLSKIENLLPVKSIAVPGEIFEKCLRDYFIDFKDIVFLHSIVQ